MLFAIAVVFFSTMYWTAFPPIAAPPQPVMLLEGGFFLFRRFFLASAELFPEAQRNFSLAMAYFPPPAHARSFAFQCFPEIWALPRH